MDPKSLGGEVGGYLKLKPLGKENESFATEELAAMGVVSYFRVVAHTQHDTYDCSADINGDDDGKILFPALIQHMKSNSAPTLKLKLAKNRLCVMPHALCLETIIEWVLILIT